MSNFTFLTEEQYFGNDKLDILKKNSHIHAENQFIEKNKNNYTIRQFCKAIKISHSEYNYYKKYRNNIYKENNRKLDIEILKIYKESKRKNGIRHYIYLC